MTLSFLMAFDYKALTHVRVGPPAELNVLIRKAQGLSYPYITDAQGRTLWVDPDCIPGIASTLKRLLAEAAGPDDVRVFYAVPEPAQGRRTRRRPAYAYAHARGQGIDLLPAIV